MNQTSQITKRVIALTLCCAAGVTAAAAAGAAAVPARAAVQAELNAADADFAVSRNDRGETFGQALVAKHMDWDLDFVSAYGQNGKEGYIRTADLPEDTIAQNYTIPVYAADGETVIDSFLVVTGRAEDVQ